MNTITLTIAATPDNLKRLADAFGDCIDETLRADDIPAHRRPSNPEAPKGETIKSAENPAAVPEKAETVAKEPENVAKPAENVATPTLSDIRIKAAEAVKAGHGEELKALLDKYEVEKVPNLPEEKYAAFFADLEAIK